MVPVLPGPAAVLRARFDCRGSLEAPDPSVFVGGPEWLKDAVATVRGLLPTPASGLLARKAAVAIVRSTRSGKTRALLELANALRAVGVVALYASFNSASKMTPEEAAGGDLVHALLRRVSFELCGGGGRAAWACCGAGDVAALLAECDAPAAGPRLPVVLLVDELSEALPPGQETAAQRALWAYLVANFLDRGDRALVLSAHYAQTVTQVAHDFVGGSQSARNVEVVVPPMVDDPAAAAVVLGVSADTLLVWGLLPAMALERDTVLRRIAQDCPAQFDLGAFAAACLSATLWSAVDPKLLLFGQAADSDKKELLYSWPPGVIAGVLTHYDTQHRLRTREPSRCGRLPDWVLAPHKQSSGEFWEATVMLAVLLHRLAGVAHPQLPPLARVDDWRFVDVPESARDVAAVLEWAATHLRRPLPRYVLAYPLAASFPTYDALELELDPGAARYHVLGGLQMKEGDKAPAPAVVSVKLSVLLSRRTPLTTRARTDGWLKVAREPLEDLLGASLSVVLPALARRTARKRHQVR